MSDQDCDDSGFSAETLEQLQTQATLLDVIDESQDVALDLHASPFSSAARERAIAFLGSSRYLDAAAKFERLRDETPSAPCGGGSET